MPRKVELHLPFPARISADAQRATEHHLAWPRSFGLLDSREAIERHAAAHYAELAARFYPAAVEEELDLGVDLMSWFFLFDDSFDGPLGRDPRTARDLVDAVSRTLSHPADASERPIAQAFAALWRRSCEGMPPAWRARATAHWRAYLAGHIDESVHRYAGTMPSVAEHLRLRRDTIGVYPTLDLAERIGRFEVPEEVCAGELLTAARDTAAEIVSIHNDICSVEKEEAQGDVHNLVLIYERERSCSRSETIKAMQRMVRERTERFLILESQLPSLSDSFHLDRSGSRAVQLYATDALRPVIRGPYDWADKSGRYSDEELAVRKSPV